MAELISMKIIAAVMMYSIIGIIILGFSFWVIDRITPQNLWKEIVEEKNMALAILAGAMMIAIGQIIAAAVHG